MNRLDYKGMKVETNGNYEKPVVRVFWNSCFLNPLYITTSLDKAMRWVDAYQKGEQWAEQAKLPAKVG